jgi:hypothetical protein
MKDIPTGLFVENKFFFHFSRISDDERRLAVSISGESSSEETMFDNPPRPE